LASSGTKCSASRDWNFISVMENTANIPPISETNTKLVYVCEKNIERYFQEQSPTVQVVDKQEITAADLSKRTFLNTGRNEISTVENAALDVKINLHRMDWQLARHLWVLQRLAHKEDDFRGLRFIMTKSNCKRRQRTSEATLEGAGEDVGKKAPFLPVVRERTSEATNPLV
ncbi:hypothetical protein STEG23_028321, partial [Scotinomys teguina]